MKKLMIIISIFYYFLLPEVGSNAFQKSLADFDPLKIVPSKSASLSKEIASIRGLAFGFLVTCEKGTLFMRSSSAGNFRISKSILCNLFNEGLYGDYLNEGLYGDYLIVCSSDPQKSLDDAGKPIPPCLKFTLEEN
jgi:hypothetical protein